MSKLQSWTKLLRKLRTWAAFFSKLRSRLILTSPFPSGSSVVRSSKESRIPRHLYVGSNFELGEGVFFMQSC